MGPGKLVFLEVRWISSQVNSARSIRKRGANNSMVPGRANHWPQALASIARQGRSVSHGCCQIERLITASVFVRLPFIVTLRRVTSYLSLRCGHKASVHATQVKRSIGKRAPVTGLDY